MSLMSLSASGGKSSESEPVRTGLVGLHFGAGLADRELFSGAGGEFVKIIGVCDRDGGRASFYGGRHGVPYYTDLSALLAMPGLEAVMLMTPPAGRAGLVHQCLAAGKHVLTTKPFELDPGAARRVLWEARDLGLAVHLNSPGPFPSSDLEQIRNWQSRFQLGRPVSGHWETYASYSETVDGSWFDSFEKCPVSPVFRLGIYGINELIAVMGEVDSVEVASSRISTGRPTADNASLLIRFAGGGIGTVHASLCIVDGSMYPAELILHFENGTIRKTQIRPSGAVEFDHLEMELRTVVDGRPFGEKAVLPAGNRSGAYQYRNFHRRVRSGFCSGEVSPELVAAGIRVIAQMKKKEQEFLNCHGSLLGK